MQFLSRTLIISVTGGYSGA